MGHEMRTDNASRARFMVIDRITVPMTVASNGKSPEYYLALSGFEMLTLGALPPSKITPLVQCEENTHGTFFPYSLPSDIRTPHRLMNMNITSVTPFDVIIVVIDIPHRRDIGLSAYHPCAFPWNISYVRWRGHLSTISVNRARRRSSFYDRRPSHPQRQHLVMLGHPIQYIHCRRSQGCAYTS